MIVKFNVICMVINANSTDHHVNNDSYISNVKIDKKAPTSVIYSTEITRSCTEFAKQ